MKLGRSAGAFLFAAVLLACGSSSDDAAANAAKAEAQAQDEFLSTYCQIILPCCNKVLSLPADDIAGCKTHLSTIDPITPKNEQARTDCITQARAVASLPTFCTNFQAMNTPSCPDPTRAKNLGTKKAGEVCTTVQDCAPDYTGLIDCASGVCQLRKRGKEGDGPCDCTIDGTVITPSVNAAQGADVVDCFLALDGLQCDSVTQKCAKPLGTQGPTCKATSECSKINYCDDDSHQCFAKQVKSSKCDNDDECQGHCDQDGGGFCADPNDVNGDCSANSWCKAGLECDSGKCVQPGPDQRLASSCH